MGALALAVLLSVPAFSQQASSAAPAVTLAAVGDIRLSGPVGDIIKKSGIKAPAAEVKHLLAGDIVFGNLETAMTDRGDKTVKKFNFRSPRKNLAMLKDAGFTILNIANNHVWDYGQEGFEDTLAALRKYEFPYIGGGKDLEEAEATQVVEINGLKIGFLGFTSTFPQEGWAKKNKPGVNYAKFEKVADVVAAGKKECDVLVVSFHGGTEIAEYPNDIQKSFAHAAVSAGADLVLGHHPHVLQPVEVYQGRPILYSLGNFFFVSPSTATKATAIAKVQLTNAGVSLIEFVPVDTNAGTPVPAGPERAHEVFEKLDRLGALTQNPRRFRVSGLTPGIDDRGKPFQ